MKNITVSVDEETHRMARIRAAELDTSVSALVRNYLRTLGAEAGCHRTWHQTDTGDQSNGRRGQSARAATVRGGFRPGLRE